MVSEVSDAEKIAELSAALAINKESLDDELIRHAELRWHASELSTKWTSLRDMTKHKIKKLESDLDGKIRDEASADGSKVTEKEIERLIARRPEVLALQEQLLKESAIVRRVDALVSDYAERRHMLEKLVDLYTSNYWSTPRPTAAVRDQAATRVRTELTPRRRQTLTPKGEPRE